MLRAEFEAFHLSRLHAQLQLWFEALAFRGTWDAAFRDYLKELDQDKPVVCCGDLNVAHRKSTSPVRRRTTTKPPATPAGNRRHGRLQQAGLVDTWRAANPDTVKYSWWSYRGGAREKNVGWRLDYMLVSERAMPHVQHVEIHNDVLGSDHCPVSLSWQS